MSEITTRYATADDIPRLIEIWKEQADIELQLDGRLFGVGIYETSEIETAISGILNYNDGQYGLVVAERMDRIVGFIFLYLDKRQQFLPTRASIKAMAIDPHDGQGGVGTVLLDRCMEILREHGVKALTVTAPKHHAVQQAFWRAKGGRVIQETFYLPVKDDDDKDGE